jgi:hypothetical protein
MILTAAVGAALGAAVLNIVSGISILAGGMDLVVKYVSSAAYQHGTAVDPALIDTESDTAKAVQTVYTAIASSTIFWSLVLATLAAFALRGGRTTRVISTVILVISALMKLIDVRIMMPTVSGIADALVVVLALTAAVLFFLPAANAYGKSRRTAKAAGVRV